MTIEILYIYIYHRYDVSIKHLFSPGSFKKSISYTYISRLLISLSHVLICFHLLSRNQSQSVKKFDTHRYHYYYYHLLLLSLLCRVSLLFMGGCGVGGVCLLVFAASVVDAIRVAAVRLRNCQLLCMRQFQQLVWRTTWRRRAFLRLLPEAPFFTKRQN